MMKLGCVISKEFCFTSFKITSVAEKLRERAAGTGELEAVAASSGTPAFKITHSSLEE